MAKVDQVTRRRIMRTGLTALDPDRACPGFVLYSCNGAGDSVYLIDMEGREVHRWRTPLPPRYGYLLPNGNLFVLLKTGADTGPLWPAWPTHQTGFMAEMDWEGRVIWQHEDPYQHHDARRTASGDGSAPVSRITFITWSPHASRDAASVARASLSRPAISAR